LVFPVRLESHQDHATMIGEVDIYGAGTMPHPEINKWSCLPRWRHEQNGANHSV